MLRFINRIAKSLASDEQPSGKPWLQGDGEQAAPGHRYLYTLHLRGVVDPFDPDPLWSREYGGDAPIQDVSGKRTDRRLRMALDAHRQIELRHDDARGYWVEDPRVFADVLLRVPASAWTIRGAEGRVVHLLDKLASRHNEEFQDRLLGDRAPRYHVIPEPSLQAGEVLCQFGLGLFLPNAEDRIDGEVTLRMEELQRPIDEWRTFVPAPARQISRAAGLYQGQDFLLLSPDPLLAPIAPPLWPKGLDGWLLIDLRGEQPELETDGEQLQAGDVRRDSSDGPWICNATTQDGRALEILIEREKKSAASEEAREPSPSGTLVFPRKRTGPRLELAGIALPRIDAHRLPGLSEWALRLDGEGMPRADGELLLRGEIANHRLSLRLPGERRGRQIEPPVTLAELDARLPPTKIAAAPLPEYLGILQLPPLRDYPLPRAPGMALIGRAPGGDPAAHAIPLTLLAQADSLLWSDNRGRRTLNDLISANYARLRQEEDGLRIELVSENNPLHLLDERWQLREVLEPGTAKQPLLEDGGLLLLGLYLLRYRKGR